MAPLPYRSPPSVEPATAYDIDPVVQRVAAPAAVRIVQPVAVPDGAVDDAGISEARGPVAGGATADASATGTAPGGVPAPVESSEELLKRLYDPLVRRLKADLRLDRERRGSPTDVWH